MSFGEGVEGFEFVLLLLPNCLAVRCVLLLLHYEEGLLFDCCVEPSQKILIILPALATNPLMNRLLEA